MGQVSQNRRDGIRRVRGRVLLHHNVISLQTIFVIHPGDSMSSDKMIRVIIEHSSTSRGRGSGSGNAIIDAVAVSFISSNQFFRRNRSMIIFGVADVVVIVVADVVVIIIIIMKFILVLVVVNDIPLLRHLHPIGRITVSNRRCPILAGWIVFTVTLIIAVLVAASMRIVSRMMIVLIITGTYHFTAIHSFHRNSNDRYCNSALL